MRFHRRRLPPLGPPNVACWARGSCALESLSAGGGWGGTGNIATQTAKPPTGGPERLFFTTNIFYTLLLFL
jgi:hypothetical protein